MVDKSGAGLPKAKVTALNTENGFSRTTTASDTGTYQIPLLRVGDYTVTAELGGFHKEARKIHLDIGATAVMDFTLQVGEVAEQVTVQGAGEAVESTRSMVSEVIAEREIQTLPINGRQFIDFALLAPGVTVGNTTSGSTDVIVEPVTKIAFAGQNIHYNFIAVDGADDISTASGVQKATPSQEAVQEFRVINSSYSAEYGRAVGGIVNVISKSGTNDFHGSLYEYFRNDAMDARNLLSSPGLDKLRQNQFGGTLGGPMVKDKTFFFGNYEGQRRYESPTYNSIITNPANLALINSIRAGFGLPAENLNVTRATDYDNMLVKLDHMISNRQALSVRYLFDDQRLTNVSALNDGFDMPSTFRNNDVVDHSLAGSLNSTFSSSLLNELRVQYAHRNFDFPAKVAEPHLEVSNELTMGINRGNPERYIESRFELVDNVTKNYGRHTLQFGGNFSYVRTRESFPLFYPFEATFGCLRISDGCGVSLEAGAPAIIFFEKFDTASGFNEPNFVPVPAPGVFAGPVAESVRSQAEGELNHTYDGLYGMDKWRATPNLTLTFGLRWEFETWPSQALSNDLNNVDPRFGFAYHISQHRNVVIRGGIGLFHGIIPSPLLMCQIPSCGGTRGPLTGRSNIEDTLDANTRLLAYIPLNFIQPNSNVTALQNLFAGVYPQTNFVPGNPTGVVLDATVVRFAQHHQAPYGIQNSLGVEFELFKDATLDVSYLGVRGRALGSFFNANQPLTPTGTLDLFNSRGVMVPTNFFGTPGGPGAIDPSYLIYFEADSHWNSQYDGLLVNMNKRMSHHVGMGLSYTWSKGIDNGPNPSFVLVPVDITRMDNERALSSDHVAHRFVGNVTLESPTKGNPLVRNWELGLVLTLESPHYFTKFSGSDVNGTGFFTNQRVGAEPRNTFQGDSYQSADIRVSRKFDFTERAHLQAIAEAFNLTNTVNVKYFNTLYGAADFCPFDPLAAGCPAIPSANLEGSPLSSYGTPRAVYNPRQIQFALRLTF